MTGQALSVRLQGIRWEADGILSLDLRAPDEGPLPGWEVGAHIDVHLPNGLVRSYSLINQPADNRRYVVAIALDRSSRGGSRFVHQSLRPGQILQVDPPRNHFPLVDGDAPIVLIAGGIGVTPLYAMATALAAANRPFQFIYTSRSRAHAAFTDAVAALGRQARLHFDDEEGGRLIDIAAIVQAAPDNAHFYCCGPTGMLSAFEHATVAIPPERIHVERFAANPRSEQASGKPHAFKVILARNGRQLEVPADRSILDVLLEAGLPITYSCTDGLCGSCETGVLAGECEHRDMVLTNAERAANNTMMVCVSRCKGDALTLDL